ncbi:hypothetical protein D9M69_605400 [compost metagenome]
MPVNGRPVLPEKLFEGLGYKRFPAGDQEIGRRHPRHLTKKNIMRTDLLPYVYIRNYIRQDIYTQIFCKHFQRRPQRGMVLPYCY